MEREVKTHQLSSAQLLQLVSGTPWRHTSTKTYLQTLLLAGLSEGWLTSVKQCEILNACHQFSEISALFFPLFPLRSLGREASKAVSGALQCHWGFTPYLTVPATNPGQSELGNSPEKLEMLFCICHLFLPPALRQASTFAHSLY